MYAINSYEGRIIVWTGFDGLTIIESQADIIYGEF